MWVKLTGIEIEGLKATEIARKMEGYVTETCQELRKEITQLQTQVKDGLARALEVESSIGAQDAELARVTAALEALQKQGGGMATTDDPSRGCSRHAGTGRRATESDPTGAARSHVALSKPVVTRRWTYSPRSPGRLLFVAWICSTCAPSGSVGAPGWTPSGRAVRIGPPVRYAAHGRDDFSSPALGWPANFAVDTSAREPVRLADQAWAFVSRTCPAGDSRCWLRRCSELSPVSPPECEPDADELGAGAHPRPSQEDPWS